MEVDGAVSDLFFNLDLEHAKKFEYDKTEVFIGWDIDILKQEAEWFCRAINSISPTQGVTPDDIVKDFLDRI